MEHKFISINGHQIFVAQHKIDAQKPTIIFLHDSLGCYTLWRDFPEKLAQLTNCNVFIYDRLGYGQSDEMPTWERPTNYLELEADFLADVIQTCQLKNVILFGHSDGGSISLIAASKYPELIKVCIVEAAHIFVDDITLEGIYEAQKAYKETNLAERLAKYHGNKVETLFKAWTETWTMPSYKDWNIEHFLPNITAPLLFIQGENDEYGTIHQVNTTIEKVSGFSEKAIIAGIGHTPHKENPEETLTIAAQFINKQLSDK